MSLCGVAPDGVYIDRQVAMPLVSSYLTFPPLRQNDAVYFCCTFLEVAFTGSYPAPCPMEPGLSSDTAFRHCTRDYLAYSIFVILFRTLY